MSIPSAHCNMTPSITMTVSSWSAMRSARTFPAVVSVVPVVVDVGWVVRGRGDLIDLRRSRSVL
jgi:hypothetical protein